MVLKFFYPDVKASEPNCSPSIHFARSRFTFGFRTRVVLPESAQ
jgi:hypothetical protein